MTIRPLLSFVLALIAGSCASATTTGGIGASWEPVTVKAPSFDDEAALSAALVAALEQTDSRALGPCRAAKTHVEAVFLGGTDARQQFAQAVAEATVASSGCIVVHRDVPNAEPLDETVARLVVLGWGWQVEGYSTVVKQTVFGMQVGGGQTDAARIRAVAEVALHVFAGDGAVVTRGRGASPWRKIAVGGAWPMSTLPAVNNPVPASGRTPSPEQRDERAAGKEE